MKRLKHYRDEETLALNIAERLGMRELYETARAYANTPLEALEEWDLVTLEERAMFVPK